MRLLGEIVKLQVQIASLKAGEPPRRHYDPAPLRAVEALILTEAGVEGLVAGGETLPDVHNRNHPASKNRGGTNGISIGFDSHYEAMRRRFGEHVANGIAGENILVALANGRTILTEEDFVGGLIVESAAGPIRLEEVIVAAPCAEFTRYAMRFPPDARPDRTVTEALQFLDDGLRGFYAAYGGPAARIRIGDRVFLP